MIGVPKLILLVALASFVRPCLIDGIWHPILYFEECDDANHDYGDGCTPNC
jgi:cysteine-rich repeat protein